jgi:hypothetical protein
VKKRQHFPPRRDSRITSQYIPDTGDILIGVARGITGGGEILYRIEPEKLAGAIEDRKELAVIVNNLGLLVLAQLSGFNLAESLDDLPRALAKWGHIEKEFDAAQAEKQVAEALAIAQKTLRDQHFDHGQGDADDGPSDSDCGCRGGADQTICASAGCGFCRAAEDMARKESDEGRDSSGHGEAGPSTGAGSESAGGPDDSGGAGPGDGLAANELGA